MTAQPVPPDDADALGLRHLRTFAGLVGMVAAVVLAVLVQIVRNAHNAAFTQAIATALVAHGCPPGAVTPPPVVLPTTWMQVFYTLAVPVVMPVMLFAFSFLLFSPTLMGQILATVRSFLPWNKGP